jgi:glycosyltransferase involved in cell wall biosynthesis
LRILHVIPDVNGGGASRAAYRIHHSLRKAKIDSSLLVLNKTEDEPYVIALNQGFHGFLRRKFYKYKNRSFEANFIGFQTKNSASHSLGLAHHGLMPIINGSNADIIHLHWINNMLSIDNLAAIQRPIVWTFHDMWPFCGAEHYTMDDSPTARFRIGYCDFNRPNYEEGPDLNKLVWQHKMKAWSQKQFQIVCCSEWLLNCANGSQIFAKSIKNIIHHPLDLDTIYLPHSMSACRSFFQLPSDKKIIIAGAIDGIQNPYKGGDLLLEAAKQLSTQGQNDLLFCLFGNDDNINKIKWPLPVVNIGRIYDEKILAKLYSAADIFVLPSRQEAFGQVASEALACGTPIVAFNHGGPTDIIEHGVTGYLAKPYDPNDLANGIRFILTQDTHLDERHPRSIIRKACRTRALKLFSPKLAAKRYLQVYQEALKMQKFQ